MHREVSHLDSTLGSRSNEGLYFLAVLVCILLALHFGPEISGWLLSVGFDLGRWPRGVTLFGAEYSFALIAALIGGVRILHGSLESMLEGRFGADLALAIAVVAAIGIAQPEVAAEVVFIGLVGECLEAVTFSRTQRELRRLAELTPRMCLVLRDGEEVKTPVADVRQGERIVVRPGKRVPVDGRVVEGSSTVDQSTLTGESLPVDKSVGDLIYAGTINRHGALIVEVDRIAEHTVVGRVVEMTVRAIKEKSPLERTADRLARYFLPAVLGLAAITYLAYLGWLGFKPVAWVESAYPALSVLVVACPCALILATPASIIAALGRLAGTGVMLRGGAAIERLATVDTFAFDKTGTLTLAQLQLADWIWTESGTTPNELLQLAASVESRSEHPLATLLVAQARQRGLELLPIEDFTSLPGAGVFARTSEGPILVGNLRLFQERGIALPTEAEQLLATIDDHGATPMLVARSDQLLGILSARDTIRPEAVAVLRSLERSGIADLLMLTGDRGGAARAVAHELSIPRVESELLPEQKAQAIEALQQAGKQVAMIGDGVNDAPALARARVGLALGSMGADLAAEAGDFVLMGDPLKPLPLLVRLSRQTVVIIRQNILFFAFGVNAVGIILTAWIMPTWSEAARHRAPIWAAVYHQIGSILVLLNAMRLLWFEGGPSIPLLEGFGRFSAGVDHFLERLNFHDLSHLVFEHWRRIMLALAGLALAAFVLSGLVVVNSSEVGIVKRFGQVLNDPLQPGLHYRWPWPLEKVLRIEPQRVRSLEIGYRTLSGSATPTGPANSQTWTSTHGDGISREPEEGLVITGDGSLVELQLTVLYTIDDPKLYVLASAHPESILRAEAEAVTREIIARRSFQQLLMDDREAFQQEVLVQLRERLRSQRHSLGLRIEQIAVQDLHPPLEVVESYYNVTRALTERHRKVIEAERLRDSTMSLEERGRVTVVSQAESEREAVVKLAAAEVAGIRKLQRMLDEQSPGAIDAVQQLWILETVERVLANRPKILRDARLKGRLHVLPEAFRPRGLPEPTPPRKPFPDG